MANSGFGVQMSGGKKLRAFIEGESRKHAKGGRVQVGYSKNYAIWVHELTHLNHKVGQAKFLEQPMRQYHREILDIVARKVGNHRSLDDALFAAGQFLLSKSQEIVPVDTGALKASGFVRKA